MDLKQLTQWEMGYWAGCLQLHLPSFPACIELEMMDTAAVHTEMCQL